MNASARLTTLTRVGFATRGILYLVIAFLIVRTGRAEDTSGALQFLAGSGGRLLLSIMAAGLLAYGIWRLCDAAFDIERHGTDRKGIFERLGAGISGLVHLVLAWQAFRLIQGVSSVGNGTEQGTQAALDLPGGTAIVMLGAAVLFAVGVVQLIKAAKGSFLKHLEPAMAQHAWARWSGRAGYAARGLVFIISSWFLLQAGLQAEASEAGGMAEALSWLESPWDFVVAIGLFGFGVFSLIEARYRILHDVPVDGLTRRVAGAA
ncbi:DUF1206 domain-containing protein [Sphingomonas radiodurans]|uniref:DUF1206 domain-containing protein n=1 Tax=Sphingomonas radiodurans TaxID=2890321 RepID=UPI001E51776E|nr:DUF1206 domain-containing protein [Sphingomonas radiodurans]WBH17221.1 DUF1206 domain-containing protein [Sphingomonas radiodurans]